MQGLLSVGIGVYIDHNISGAMTPPLPTTIALIVLVALFDEMANGANFSLVPHCNPDSNGFVTGIVGAMGNLGGIWFALVWRYQPHPFGRAFWIAGVISMVRSYHFERSSLIALIAFIVLIGRQHDASYGSCTGEITGSSLRFHWQSTGRGDDLINR